MGEATGGVTGRDRRFAIGVARAAGGAIIFTLPLFMTMEMWWLGFYIDRLRFALLLLLTIPLLIGLSAVSGFEQTIRLGQDALDAFVAIAVAFVTSAAILALLGIVEPGMSLEELAGKTALQAVPGGMGALLAQSQFGGARKKRETRNSYGGELLLMTAGALLLAFNLAPTQEMVVIANKLAPWQVLLVAVVSIALMHAFVYAVEFHGQESAPAGTPQWRTFVQFTVVGYAIALTVSVYMLWTFGRLDGESVAMRARDAIVLGLPAAVGAAAARLLV